MISEGMVKKFRKLYKEKFGKEISKKEAYEQGIKLLKLVQVIYRPLLKKNTNNITH